MGKKTLYLECYSGISGDMTVASLLDLGVDHTRLLDALNSLNLDGYRIEISRVLKAGIDACDFNVVLDAAHENHDHDMEYLHGHPHHEHHDHWHDHEHHHDHDHHDHWHDHEHHHEHHHEHDHEHDHHDHWHDHEHHHDHDHHDHWHDHEHHHDHDHHDHWHDHEHHHHDHGHHHHHDHRNLHDIQAIIYHSGLTERAKDIALKIFQVIAEAECKAHNKPLDEVHFHEVGAVDSIVDIVAIAVCLDALNIEDVIVSELYEGQGTVRCQHGILPIPVPAVANIVSAYGLPMHIMDIQGEFVTPTGAAIVAALRTGDKLPKRFRLIKTGIGAGKRNYEKASILRAMLIEDLDAPSEDAPVSVAPGFELTIHKELRPAEVRHSSKAIDFPKREVDLEPIWKVETNLDDCTGETIAFAEKQLFEAGAQDVYTTPIYMKKNRPATMLTVLCRESLIEKMEDVLFTHTTTIGIRKYPVERTVLPREIRSIETPWGMAKIKYVTWKGHLYAYPENDDVAAIAESQHLSFPEVYAVIKTLAYEAVHSDAFTKREALPENE